MRIGLPRPALMAVLLAVLAGQAACSKSDPKPGSETAPAAAPAQPAARTDPASGGPCAGPEKKGPLAWFEDDYDAALACARATNRPVFIDLWAPWCHTCIAMQSGVFMDPALKPLADRFVWLAINTDRDKNAALQIKFPAQVWPTFYVVAPADESIQARFPGSTSLTQFREFLLQGEKGFLESAGASLEPGSPLARVRDGDRAVVAKDYAAAATAYREALAGAPADWPRRPDVLVSLISVLFRGGEVDPCIDLAEAELGSTGNSASVSDFIYQARRCFDVALEQDASAYQARVARLRDAAMVRLAALIDDVSAPLSADDRSDVMVNLRELYLAVGKKPEAMAMAERQRAFLDRAAAEAPNPFTAMTYNWPRSEVYVFLGKPGELVADLEKSAAALPGEYDPLYRLAWIYLNMGEHQKALDAAEKALGLAYGPRKGRVQRMVAEVHKARGDKAAERAARRAVVAIYENLPEGQKNEASLEEARAELAAMDSASPAAK